MTTRDVQDYEAQAGKLFRAVMDAPPRTDRVGMIAAALRAASNAALERAAQLCQDDATYQERGDPRGMALSTAAQRIRALIAPAPESPPGPAAYADALQDPVHKTPGKLLSSRPLRTPAPMVTCSTDTDEHHGAHRLREPTRGEESWCKDPIPASAHESPPATDPIHEAYPAADEYGQPPSAEPQPPHWRNGRHYAIHVYCGDMPIATFHTVDAAQAAVRAYNANLDLSAPAPDLAAQLDELSNALASHADAETGAKWDRLRAAVGARDERMAALEAALAKAHDAIRWACGDEPLKDGRWFDCRAFGHKDNAAPRYWWRSILRLYSGLPDDPAPSKEPPP